MATGAIHFQTVVQFFDAVFDVSALTVELVVDPAGGLLEIGAQKMLVVAGRTLAFPHHFGFVDHPPSLFPSLVGLIAKLPIEPLTLTAGGGTLAHGSHLYFGLAVQ